MKRKCKLSLFIQNILACLKGKYSQWMTVTMLELSVNDLKALFCLSGVFFLSEKRFKSPALLSNPETDIILLLCLKQIGREWFFCVGKRWRNQELRPMARRKTGSASYQALQVTDKGVERKQRRDK